MKSLCHIDTCTGSIKHWLHWVKYIKYIKKKIIFEIGKKYHLASMALWKLAEFWNLCA